MTSNAQARVSAARRRAIAQAAAQRDAVLPAVSFGDPAVLVLAHSRAMRALREPAPACEARGE